MTDDHNTFRHFDCQNERPAPMADTFTHARIRSTARQLADQINAGMFAGLTPDERCDLRALTLEMLGWADEVYEMEVPRGRVVNLRPALVVINGGAREVWR